MKAITILEAMYRAGANTDSWSATRAGGHWRIAIDDDKEALGWQRAYRQYRKFYVRLHKVIRDMGAK